MVWPMLANFFLELITSCRGRERVRLEDKRLGNYELPCSRLTLEGLLFSGFSLKPCASSYLC